MKQQNLYFIEAIRKHLLAFSINKGFHEKGAFYVNAAGAAA